MRFAGDDIDSPATHCPMDHVGREMTASELAFDLVIAATPLDAADINRLLVRQPKFAGT